MKVSLNIKIIERNKKIAQYTLYISLALLVVGFIWSIRNTDPEKSFLGWLILFPSFLLVQLSTYMSNKWGKSPRPDEIISQSLKGLNDDFTFYNFSTAVPHLLIGPQGIWVLNAYLHKGEISYDVNKSKYIQKGGAGFIGKFFGQEKLPNISKDSLNLNNDLAAFFTNEGIDPGTDPLVINVFLSDNVDLRGKNFPEICIKAEKLKSLVRRESKNKILTTEEISKITNLLPQTK